MATGVPRAEQMGAALAPGVGSASPSDGMTGLPGRSREPAPGLSPGSPLPPQRLLGINKAECVSARPWSLAARLPRGSWPQDPSLGPALGEGGGSLPEGLGNLVLRSSKAVGIEEGAFLTMLCPPWARRRGPGESGPVGFFPATPHPRFVGVCVRTCVRTCMSVCACLLVARISHLFVILGRGWLSQPRVAGRGSAVGGFK